MRLPAVLALLLAAAVSGCIQVEVGATPEAPAPAADDGLTTLRLLVVDGASGAALSGADVRLSLATGGITKQTGADGSVAFTVRPAASCSAAVARTGYAARTAALDCGSDRSYRIPLSRTAPSPGGGSPSSSRSGSPSPSPAPGPAGNASGNGTGGDGADGNGTARPFEPREPSGSCGSLGSLDPIVPDLTLAPGLVTGWPLLRIDVAVLADPAFVAAHPADWRALLSDLVSDANAVYEPQLGLHLNLTLLDRLPDGSLAPGSGDGRQRAVARGFMDANHPGADVDLVAVILGADYEGTVAGEVECVHGAGFPDYSYLWAEYDDTRENDAFVGPVGIFEDIPLKTFMHEAAHLFGAQHHFSDCAEAYASARTSDALGACDIMINDVGLASFRFGPTNRLVARTFVEDIGIGEPV